MRWDRRWNGFGYTDFVMEDRIKQRLTGAAIVVALLVLLVPEMFRGRPPATPPVASGGAGGPPVRSYTIELRDRAAGSGGPGAASPPMTSDQPALAASPEQPPAATTGAPAAVPGAGAATAGQAPTAAPGAAPGVAPGAAAPPAAAVPATTPATTPATPAPAAASAPEPAPVAPAASGGPADAERYQVQLGLFASRANAERLAAKVARQGVKVRVSGPDARNLYRVHTPTYRTRDEAQAIQQKLRELGLTAALTPQR
jgi:cell division protein FtsN